MKTLSEALRNISLQSHVLNVFTTKGGASASAISSVKVGAGSATNAGAQTSSVGGTKTKQVSKGGGTGTGTGSGKVTGPSTTFPVVEPKQGENVKELAKTYVTSTGAASRG